MIYIEALKDLASDELSSMRIRVEPEAMALLPKGVRIKANGHAYIEFRSNGSNGGINETGVRRVRALFKAIDKHNIPTRFHQPAHVKDELNSRNWSMVGLLIHITREQVEARLG